MKTATVAAISRRRDFLRVMDYKRKQLEEWQVTESVDLYFLLRRKEIGRSLAAWLKCVREHPEDMMHTGAHAGEYTSDTKAEVIDIRRSARKWANKLLEPSRR